MTRAWRRGAGWLVASVLCACAVRSQGAPEAGYERGVVPALAGSRVMVLPVQVAAGGGVDLDREIEFALSQSNDAVQWLFPDELRETIARSPGLDLAVDNLPVGSFLVAEVERVGDPLFGMFYRLGVVSDASYALLPVEARAVQGEEGTYLELVTAVLDARSGYVMWFGVVRGSEGPPDDIVLQATLAEALARRVAG